MGTKIIQQVTGGNMVYTLPDEIVIQSMFQAGGWLPTDESNLELWLKWDTSTMYQEDSKTTAVSSASDPVGAWEDQSGNGNDALQSTSGARPLYQTDGITFDGTADYLTGSITSYTGTALTYFAVMQIVTNKSTYEGYWTLAETDGTSNDVVAPSVGLFIRNNASVGAVTWQGVNRAEQSMSLATTYIVSGKIDGTNNSMWLDGGGEDTATGMVSMTLNNFYLGARHQPTIGKYSNIKLKEIILYTDAKSTSVIDQVETYLSDTHSITLV